MMTNYEKPCVIEDLKLERKLVFAVSGPETQLQNCDEPTD